MGRRKEKAREVKRMLTGRLVRLASRETPPAVEVKGEMNGGIDLTGVHVNLHIPTHLDESDEGAQWFRLGSIMSAILATGIVWIGIVWWLVSRMPEK